MKCARCKCPNLEDVGYNTYYNEDGKVLKHLCQPCVTCADILDYHDDGRICTKLMVEASMAKREYERRQTNNARVLRLDVDFMYTHYMDDYLKVADAVEKLDHEVKAFDEKIWLPSLLDYYNKSSDRGHRTRRNKEGFRALMWGCAGRVMITLEKGKNGPTFTMIFSDWVPKTESDFEMLAKYGRTRGGIQGIDATFEEAMEMVKWAQKGLKFRADKQVRMAGL